MRYIVIVLLLTAVIMMLGGVVISYVRKEVARNDRHSKQAVEDLPTWGSPPDVKY